MVDVSSRVATITRFADIGRSRDHGSSRRLGRALRILVQLAYTLGPQLLVVELASGDRPFAVVLEPGFPTAREGTVGSGSDGFGGRGEREAAAGASARSRYSSPWKPVRRGWAPPGESVACAGHPQELPQSRGELVLSGGAASGECELAVVLDSWGRVLRLAPVDCPEPDLQAARAIEAWTFQPPRDGLKCGETEFLLSLDFRAPDRRGRLVDEGTEWMIVRPLAPGGAVREDEAAMKEVRDVVRRRGDGPRGPRRAP